MPTQYEGDARQVLALNTFIKFTRSVDSFLARLNEHHTIDDLTESQFGVLEAIYHLGPMCQNELGHKILKSSGNMTLVIDNLEKKNLVKRTRSTEDRRMVMVSLTRAGEELIDRILPVHVAAITQEMNVLDPDEQEKLGELCRKLGKVSA
jgi:MarR family 2-MHQ and catechol resistance regulon transcriptional repressor